jgi:hypothetical protein
MSEVWRKYAIAGATYARALENAAAREGRAFAPDAFNSIRSQTLAKLDPHASAFVRGRQAPGELPKTPQRAAMQDLAQHIPWAGEEHTSDAMSAKAPQRFDRLLESRGLTHETPAGRPNTHQMIASEFGDPVRFRQQLRRVDNTYTPPAQESGQLTGAGGPAAMRARTPVPGGQTSVLPAAPGQQTSVLPAAPASPRQFPRARFQMGKMGAALPAIAGLGTPLAVGASMLLNKPGIRADLMDRISNPGDTHQKDVAQEIPADVLAQAHAAQQALAARGMDPKALRFAVDAPSGAGKTVLSKALAQEMGLHHQGLDWRPNAGLHQLLGGGDIERMPYTPHAGDVLEHQQLLRSYDPSAFDVAIHINRAPEQIKQQIIQRGRDARMADLLDYDKSIAVGNRAFDTLGGDAVDLGGGVMMKMRPDTGWGDALDQQLAQANIDPTGLSRHEKLLSLQGGRRTMGSGWAPYIRNPFDADEMNKLRGAALTGMQAAKSLSGSR